MLLFLDIETTGLTPETAEIIELSAVRWDGTKIVATFDELIALGSESTGIPPLVERLTGITAADLEGKPDLATVRTKFLEKFLRPDDIIVGHNIGFDTGFLRGKEFVFPNAEIDTYSLTTIILPDEESHSLEVLTEKYKLPHENAHRALSDAIANLELWKFLAREYVRHFSPELQEKYRSFLARSSWSGKQFFLEMEPPKASVTEIPPQLELEFSPPVIDKAVVREEETPLGTNILQFQTEVQRIFHDGEKALWEVVPSIESDPFKVAAVAATTWSAEQARPIGISFHAGAALKIKKLRTQLEAQFPQLRFCEFCRPDGVLCTMKWGQFLQKVEFSDMETIVGLKVLRQETLGSYAMPNLRREERTVWAQLSDFTHIDCSDDCPGKRFLPERILENFDVCFLPHRLLSVFPGKNLLIVGAEYTDDIATLLASERLASFELRSIAKGTAPQLSEKISFWIDFFSSFLRRDQSENAGPGEIRIDARIQGQKDWSEFALELGALRQEAESLFADNALTAELKRWVKFLEPGTAQNTLRLCRFAPDGEFELLAEPIDLTAPLQKFLAEKRSVLLLGWPFPKKKDGTWSFSFRPDLFPIQKRTSFLAVEKLEQVRFLCAASKTGDQDDPRAIARWVEACSLAEEGNTLAVFSSQKNVEAVVDQIAPRLAAQGIKIVSTLSGSPGKARALIATPGKKLLIGTSGFLERLLPLANVGFHTVFYQKFSFDPPGNLLIAERKRLFNNAFEDFLFPRSRARFEKELFRLLTVQEEPYDFICFDPRIRDKAGFGSWYRAVLPPEMMMREVEIDELEKVLNKDVS